MMSTTRLKLGSVLAILFVVAAIAAGADTYWQHDPATPGDWLDPVNWSAGVPSDADSAYIDNGGTAVIASDIDFANCHVGETGQGSVLHLAGAVPSGTIYLGYGIGGVGTYELIGDASLETSVQVGGRGDGTFLQAGGAATLAGLGIGEWDEGHGHYLLQSGHLYVASSPSDLSIRTSGLFEQTGGTSIAQYTHIGYGESGGGTLRLSGGTYTTSRLHLGVEPYRPEARVELSGTGRLEASDLWVGVYGLGRFVQTGGECVGGRVDIGPGAGNSVYELHGGLLSAELVYVGDDWYDEPEGTFVQSGGNLTVGRFVISPASLFEFTGGLMAFIGGLLNEGTFDFAAGGGTLELVAGSMLDLSKGTIANAANGRINAAANTLVMFPSGFDPGADLAGYASAGVTHIAGATMTVPAHQHLVAVGTIEGRVRCEGSLRVPDSSTDRLDITDGLKVVPGADVDLGQGAATVEDMVSGVTGGELNAGHLYVGRTGAGAFTQMGGTVYIRKGTLIGDEPGSQGTYVMEDGEMSALGLDVGYEGTGRVVHTGGTFIVRGSTPTT